MKMIQRTNLNLFRPQYRRRVLLRRSVLCWLMICTVVAAGGSAVCARAGWTHSRIEHELNRFQREHAPMRRLSAEVEGLEEKLKTVESERRIAETLENPYPTQILLNEISRVVEASEGSLRLTNLTLQGQGAVAPTGKPAHEVTLHGEALTSEAIYALLAELRSTDLFAEVKLKTSTDTKIQQTKAFEFEIHCSY